MDAYWLQDIYIRCLKTGGNFDNVYNNKCTSFNPLTQFLESFNIINSLRYQFGDTV